MAGISVLGATKLIDKLERLSGRQLDRAIEDGVEQAANELHTTLAKYPPPLPTYRRTGNLGRAWHVERRGKGAVVGNSQSYAPWVQSSKQQRWYHKRTGWTTDRQAVDQLEQSGEVERIMSRTINRILGG